MRAQSALKWIKTKIRNISCRLRLKRPARETSSIFLRHKTQSAMQSPDCGYDFTLSDFCFFFFYSFKKRNLSFNQTKKEQKRSLIDNSIAYSIIFSLKHNFSIFLVLNHFVLHNRFVWFYFKTWINQPQNTFLF